MITYDIMSWRAGLQRPAQFRGNHLSDTTCLSQVVFKSGEHVANIR